MVKVVIVRSLILEIKKRFSKKEGNEIIDLMNTIQESPRKGKPVGSIGGMVIKELKYKGFRFYFITDGHIVKFADEDELKDLLSQFVRMSDKKKQQKTIDEIKHILTSLGPDSFKPF